MSYKKSKNSWNQKGVCKETPTISFNNALQLHLISTFDFVFDLFQHTSLICCCSGGPAIIVRSNILSRRSADSFPEKNKKTFTISHITFQTAIQFVPLFSMSLFVTSLSLAPSLMSTIYVTVLSFVPP